MFRLVSLMGIAALAVVVASAHAASQKNVSLSNDDADRIDTRLRPRLPAGFLANSLPFHARFSVN